MTRAYRLPRKLWAGFSEGKIDLDQYQGPGGWYGVLYESRREAKQFYDDVRRVEVREVKK